jgi:hypothetical protein
MASTPSSVVDRRFGANKEVSHVSCQSAAEAAPAAAAAAAAAAELHLTTHSNPPLTTPGLCRHRHWPHRPTPAAHVCSCLFSAGGWSRVQHSSGWQQAVHTHTRRRSHAARAHPRQQPGSWLPPCDERPRLRLLATPPTTQAEHVARNEEGCLAYEFSVKSDDPDSVLIYER